MTLSTSRENWLLTHHVMAILNADIAVARLGDISGVTEQQDPTQPKRLVQACTGIWRISTDDERLPKILRMCTGGAYITGENCATIEQVVDLYTRFGLPAPDCAPFDELPPLIGKRLDDLADAERRARASHKQSTGRKPTWKPAPWPTLTLPDQQPDCEPPVQQVLAMARRLERCFAAWDDAESQRLRRSWLNSDEPTGGPTRQQVIAADGRWDIIAWT